MSISRNRIKHGANSLVTVVAFFLCVAAAFAQPASGSLFGSGSGEDTAAAGKPDTQISSDALIIAFVESNKQILTAQALLERAYGEKEKAEILQAEADALSNDGVTKDQLEKVVELSNATNKELEAKQAEQAQLTEEQQKYYVESLPHFGLGVVGTQQMLGIAKGYGEKSKGLVEGGFRKGFGPLKDKAVHYGHGSIASARHEMSRARAAAYVAKASPAYSARVFQTFKKTVSIGRANDVAIPADATAALSGL